MRDRRNHPWHPTVVHFPVACWVLAWVLDGWGLAGGGPVAGLSVAPVATFLLWTGNALALVAMVTGLFDFSALPGQDGLIHTAYRHMTWMTGATAALFAAGLLRQGDVFWASRPEWGAYALETLGVVALVFGGREAARLVYRYALGRLNGPPGAD